MSYVDSEDSIKRFVQNNADIHISLLMLEEGTISDINIRDSSYNDRTALMYQARYGTVESMESLLAYKPPALPNLQDRGGWMALHLAVSLGDNPAKVRLLLDYGADKTIVVRNRLGETALDWARRYNRTECIKVLESYTPKLRG